MPHRFWRFLVATALLLALTPAAFAQTVSEPQTAPATPPELSITIGAERVRFTSLKEVGAAQEISFQVFNQTGELLFDSGPRYEQELVWNLRDAAGQPLAPGLYAYTFSLRAADAAAPRQQRGHFIIEQTPGQFWLTTQANSEIGAEIQEQDLTVARAGERTIAGVRTSDGARQLAGRQVSAETTKDQQQDATGGLTPEKDGQRPLNVAIGTIGKIAKFTSPSNLGNSIMTQGNGFIAVEGALSVNNNMLRLRSATDANHGLLYNDAVNGPEFRGFGGFRWTNGTAGATERMRLTATGDLNISGAGTANSFNAATQFNIGGNRVLSVAGTNNLFAGASAGQMNTGNNNTFVGNTAGSRNTSGNNNTFVGSNAGTFLAVSNSTANNNTALGAGAIVDGAAISFATVIGAGAVVTNSNTIVLGRGLDTVRVHGDLRVFDDLFVVNLPFGNYRNVQWNTNTGQFYQDDSTRRHKENIRPLQLDFLRLLQAVPMTYTRPGDPGRWEIGFIAEDFDALGLKELVEYDADKRPAAIQYDRIPLYLTRIAASQQALLTQQQAALAELQKQVRELKQLVCSTNPQAPACQQEK